MRIDLLDITRRISALQSFLATDNGANLMSGYRRATNILRAEEKKEGAPISGEADVDTLVEDAELGLAEAIERQRCAVAEALAGEDYEAAMSHLAALRQPVDEFFDTVMVNAEDPALRLNRLRLLASLRDVTRQVADFSAIPG